MCQKFVKHARFSRKHNWADLYDHFMRTKIFILKVNKIYPYELQVV